MIPWGATYATYMFISFGYKLLIYEKFSLYREERVDGVNSAVKWTCPNIYQLEKILNNVKVDNILLDVFDKRMSKIEDLTVPQLREECLHRNLSNKGKKGKNIVSCHTYSYLMI